MKVSLLYCIILLLVATASAQNNSQSGSFLLTGRVKNNKADSFGIYLTDFLNGTKANILLDKEGAFRQTLSIEGAQNLWLLITGYEFELYVQSGDTVVVDWDAKTVEGTLAVTSPNKQRGGVFMLNLLLRKEGDFMEGLQSKIINSLSRQQPRRPSYISGWGDYLAAQRFDSQQRFVNDTIQALVNGAFNRRVQFIYNL